MAYVFGTSACTMTTTERPAFVQGVWGPYFSAMVPGLWLNEGGQSAAGAAIDHLVQFHPAPQEAQRTGRGATALSLVAWLALEAQSSVAAPRRSSGLSAMCMWSPNFSAIARLSPIRTRKALIAGLGMDTGIESLVGLYLAGLCGLGYGARQIMDAMREKGIVIDTIVVSGGAGQSPLVRQILADATGTAWQQHCREPVLLGAAILGAVAAGQYPRSAWPCRRCRKSAKPIGPMRKWELGTMQDWKVLWRCRRLGGNCACLNGARRSESP